MSRIVSQIAMCNASTQRLAGEPVPLHPPLRCAQYVNIVRLVTVKNSVRYYYIIFMYDRNFF